MKGIQESK